MDPGSLTGQSRRPAWVRSRRLWTAVAALLVALAAIVDVTITGPRVAVRWQAGLAPDERLALERRYRLEQGEAADDAGATWRYTLGDWSRGNVERIVGDPAVADTGYIDRTIFAVEPPQRRVGTRPWVAAAAGALRSGLEDAGPPVRGALASPVLWAWLVAAFVVWAARATGFWVRAREAVSHRAALALIAAVFAVSRTAAYAAGVRFDTSSLTWYWQFIDPVLLRDRLFESLFYSHTQPPLFNLFLGLNLKLFPSSYGAAMHVEYMLLGLITAVALYVLLTELGLSPLAGALLAAAFIALPATIVYENWLFYEYPTMALLVVASAALYRFLARDSVAAGLTFFGAAAAAIYIRTTFQLVWLLFVIGVLLLVKPPRLVLKCCLVPLVLVVLLYAKNAVLVGAPLTSSWFGMHLTRSTLSQTDRPTRRALVANGSLHQISLVEPFSFVEAYEGYVPLAAPTGIPVLDESRKSTGHQNFNALSYVAVSNAYLEDALWLIRHRPASYVRSVTESFALFLAPATDYELVSGNADKVRAYDLFVREAVYLRTFGVRRMGPAIIAAYVFAVAYGLVLFAQVAVRRRNPGPRNLTILFLSFTILYASALSCLTENGENQRQRFFLDPVTLAVVAVGVPALAARLPRRE